MESNLKTVLTAAYLYNRGFTILTISFAIFIRFSTTGNKWIYFAKENKYIKIEYIEIVPITVTINFHITEIFHLHEGTLFYPKLKKTQILPFYKNEFARDKI